MLVDDMGGMCIVELRFDTPPSERRLLEALQHELGPNARTAFDAIEWDADRVTFYSMKLVPLVYAAKVGQQLGGVATHGSLVIPAWAERPWREHSWLERVRISCGRVTVPG